MPVKRNWGLEQNSVDVFTLGVDMHVSLEALDATNIMEMIPD